MRKNVTDAVEILLRNFDTEFGTWKQRDSADQMHRQSRKAYMPSYEDDSSCDSSFNQVCCHFSSLPHRDIF